MKVAVKKSVLFSLLKSRLQENRTNDNPGGSQVHLSNLQSPSLDPFGVDEDDTPIQPSAHMANQLTIEKPPVEDEDYIPASKNELKNAASVIIEELPDNQVEYYYRNLHKLLDTALDKHDESMMNESFDISRKTLINDLNIVAEASTRVRRGGVRIDPEAQKEKERLNQLPVIGTEDRTEFDYSDVDGYAEAENKEDFKAGYELALQFGDLVGRFRAGEMSDAQFATQRDQIKNINLTGTIHFQTGFDQGLDYGDRDAEYFDVDANIPEESDTEIFPADERKPKIGVNYDYRSFGEYLQKEKLTPEQKDDPIVNLVIDAHLAVQEISKTLEDENTKAFQLYWTDPKAWSQLDRAYVGKVVKKLSFKLGMTNLSALSPLRVKEKFKTRKQGDNRLMFLLEKSATVINLIKKMLNLEKKRNAQFRSDFQNVAGIFNIDERDLMNQVADVLAEDYADYAQMRKFSDADKLKYLDIQILNASRIVFRNRYFGEEKMQAFKGNIKGTQSKFEALKQKQEIESKIQNLRDRAEKRGTPVDQARIDALESQIPEIPDVPERMAGPQPFELSTAAPVGRRLIVSKVSVEDFKQYKEDVLTYLDGKLKDDLGNYSVIDQGEVIVFSEEEFLGNFEVFFDQLEDDIKERNFGPSSGEDDAIDVADQTTDEIDELDDVQQAEAEAVAAEKTRRAFEKNNDLSFLAPYFGYSGASGLRQWSLKFPKRKFDMMQIFDPSTKSFPFVNALDSIYESIASEVSLALDVLIPAIEKRVTKGKPKQSKINPAKKQGMVPAYKVVGDEELIDQLRIAKTDIDEIASYFPDKSFADMLTTDPDLMDSVGGKILSTIVGDLIDPIMQDLDADLNQQIGDLVSDEVYELGYEITDEEAQWLSNYFTGLMKDIDSKSNMPKKLVDVGIDTYEKFKPIEDQAKEILNGIALQFGKKVTRSGKMGSVSKDLKYKKVIEKLILDNTTDLLEDEVPDASQKKVLKKLGGLIQKAIAEMFNEFNQEGAYESIGAALTTDALEKFSSWEELYAAQEGQKTLDKFSVEQERKEDKDDEDLIKEALLRLIRK